MRRFAVIGLGGFGQKLVIALRAYPNNLSSARDRVSRLWAWAGQGSEASETDMAKMPQE